MLSWAVRWGLFGIIPPSWNEVLRVWSKDEERRGCLTVTLCVVLLQPPCVSLFGIVLFQLFASYRASGRNGDSTLAS
jgi:hypothetical protein